MCRVLVVTKNIFIEQNLQAQLQHLDYEVYCSKDLSHILEDESPLLRHFQCVIISETFSYKEYQEIVSIIRKKAHNPLIIRKAEQELPKSESEQQGIEILSINASLEELREKIITPKTVERHYQRLNSLENAELFENKMEQLTFTNTEKRLLKAFICKSSIPECIDREELCETLWSRGVNLSTTTQLSTLVQNIRRKCAELGIQELPIETVWGRGYQLEKQFHESMTQRFARSNHL